MENKFIPWSVRLPEELYNLLKNESDKNYTTMSKTLITILLEWKNNNKK